MRWLDWFFGKNDESPPQVELVEWKQIYWDERAMPFYLITITFDKATTLGWDVIFPDGETISGSPTGEATRWVIWLSTNKQFDLKPVERPQCVVEFNVRGSAG